MWQQGHDLNLGHPHLAQQGPVTLCPTHHSTDPHSQLRTWRGISWGEMVRPEPSTAARRPSPAPTPGRLRWPSPGEGSRAGGHTASTRTLSSSSSFSSSATTVSATVPTSARGCRRSACRPRQRQLLSLTATCNHRKGKGRPHHPGACGMRCHTVGAHEETGMRRQGVAAEMGRQQDTKLGVTSQQDLVTIHGSHPVASTDLKGRSLLPAGHHPGPLSAERPLLPPSPVSPGPPCHSAPPAAVPSCLPGPEAVWAACR